jgi:hypothetical protein
MARTSLSQTSCLALLKVVNYLGKRNGKIIVTTVSNILCLAFYSWARFDAMKGFMD